jgi:hypothetical protein
MSTKPVSCAFWCFIFILFIFKPLINKSRGKIFGGGKKERLTPGYTREVVSPRDFSVPNIWSQNHMSDDSKSHTIINWADLKIDPESINH